MKFGKLATGLGGLAALMLAGHAHGEDLLNVYEQALQNDPQIREADANRRAQREARPQAIANLLPSATGTASRQRVWGPNTVGGVNLGGTQTTTSDSWRLTLTQSIFSWQDWVSLRSANYTVAQAEADYMAQSQALAQRVAQQYFAVLNARDNLEAVEAARDAIQRQLEQSEQRFEVGLIAITDVQNSRAERDNANAQVISARRSLSSAVEQLRATIGNRPTELNEPSEDMPLISPDPATEQQWVDASMEQNLTLISSRLAADIARAAVTSSYGTFLPEVSLSAYKSSQDFQEADFVNKGKGVSLNFSMNLNGLGYGNLSGTKQAQYRWIAARERLEFTSRDTERQARDAYQGVTNEIERVTALRQAVNSSRTSLQATEAGYEVGTRTAVDVLESRRLLIQAETNYSAAKYAYLNSLIQLRIAAGDLDRSVLEDINRWLTVPATTSSNAPPATRP